MQSSNNKHVLQKVETTYKMILMHLLIIIHINNQFILYKVNSIQYGPKLMIPFKWSNNYSKVHKPLPVHLRNL
jgi:hypothetical protein